jgi:predicted alpha/beta superfamily hydrolase
MGRSSFSCSRGRGRGREPRLALIVVAFAWTAFVPFAPACSSSSDTTKAPDPSASVAPAPGPTSPAPAPAEPGAVTPPGAAVTSVRVHYASTPAKPGVLTIRGSASPLSWDKSASTVTTQPGLYTWSSPDVKTDLEVKPLLGETWSRGPNYRVKPGQTVDVYPHFVESHGTVTKKYPAFVSTKLPSTRGVWVYLPPTYVENTEARFGVLYMHDAQNLFDAQTAFGGSEWKVDETMDAGAEDGSIRETIVVAVENTPARMDELTPTADPTYGGGKADQYLAMITDEIKPMVDKDLRTLPSRDETAVMGASLGGLVSAYAGVRRADVFGLVAAMSPSTWWDGTMILGEVASTPAHPAKPIRVYVDSGDSGPSNDDVTNTTELAARYRKVGYTDQKDLLHVVKAGAQHSEIYWAARLPAALHFLLGARPN